MTWKNDRYRHCLASKRIKTKFISRGIQIGQQTNIKEILNYFKNTEFKNEVALVVDNNNTIINLKSGQKDAVNIGFKTNELNQKMYHTHPDNAPPSLEDIYVYLKYKELQESWIITPDYIYILHQKDKNNVIQNLNFDVFEKGFWSIVYKYYGSSFFEKYFKLSDTQKIPYYNQFYEEFLIPGNFVYSIYKTDSNNKLIKINEVK